MEYQKNKIKGKIRALLNKTVENGASEQEAIQALKKANELMLENFIFEHDLQGVEPEKIIEVREPIVPTSYDYTMFYGSLARLFDCEVFWTSGRRGDIVFFGFESDANLAMLWSCGSRKVSKSTTKSDLVVVDSMKLKTSLETLQLEDKLYQSLIKNLSFRADSIVFSDNGILSVYNPLLKSDVVQEQLVESIILEEVIESSLY